jgi:hypothetical protein
MHLAGYIVAYTIALGCLVLCALKGKRGFVFLGVLLPLFWIIGAVRPAKPGSYWAKRFYDNFHTPDVSHKTGDPGDGPGRQSIV